MNVYLRYVWLNDNVESILIPLVIHYNIEYLICYYKKYDNPIIIISFLSVVIIFQSHELIQV